MKKKSDMIDDMAQLERSNKNATLHLLDIYIYIYIWMREEEVES